MNIATCLLAKTKMPEKMRQQEEVSKTYQPGFLPGLIASIRKKFEEHGGGNKLHSANGLGATVHVSEGRERVFTLKVPGEGSAKFSDFFADYSEANFLRDEVRPDRAMQEILREEFGIC